MHGGGLIGESSFVQCRVQKIAGAIAGEHPSSAVAAMRGRREAKDQEFCVRIAESGERLAPVSVFTEHATLFAGHFFTISHQARTPAAGHNFFANLQEFLGVAHALPFRALAMTTA